MRPRALRDERGVALLAVMTASSLVLALGLSLALTATVEVGIASNQRDGLQALHAADAAVERAMSDLAVADWDAVLTGAVTSGFFDGAGPVTLPDGSRLDVAEETNRLAAEPRPWGRNNPRWTVFAAGSLAELLPDAAVAARAYVVVWVADDPSENDAQPWRDGGPPAVEDAANRENPGRGALWLHAQAYGVAGTRRTVEVMVERDARWAAAQLRVRTWREVT